MLSSSTNPKSVSIYPKTSSEDLLLNSISITTEKKILNRKQILEPIKIQRRHKEYSNLTRSVGTQEWKQELKEKDTDKDKENTRDQREIKESREVKEMKNSCSQTILHIDNTSIETIDSNPLSESQRQLNYPKCKNNDGKKAKYLILNSKDPNETYCLKCSIKLLQKGVQIIQINQSNYHTEPHQPQSQKQPQQLQQDKRSNQNLKFFSQQLSSSYKILETNCKALENNYFFTQISQEKQKISAIYTNIIQSIQKLKQQDLNKLDLISLKILKQSNQETNYLRGLQRKIKGLMKDLFQFGQLEEGVRKMVKAAAEKIVISVGQYEPLEFSIKREDVESVKGKIFDKISREFSDQEYPIHFSFNERSELLDQDVLGFEDRGEKEIGKQKNGGLHGKNGAKERNMNRL